jgi:protein-tyrosine phosphatase
VKRIVNFAPSIVENAFINDPEFTYLSINMVDSRMDDVSWFFCEVIQFIEFGRYSNTNTLLHCEKGVSRSCSFAIAYLMWASGIRLCSQPNTHRILTISIHTPFPF